MSLKKYEDLTIQWAEDRGINTNGKATTQGLKLISEAGELALNLCDMKDIKDDIGDCLVVITNISTITKSIRVTDCKADFQKAPLLRLLGNLSDNIIKNNNLDEDIAAVVQGLKQIAEGSGLTLEECLEVAYEDIKDREGFLNGHGNFIKSTTENYDELYAEFLRNKEL